MLRAEDESGNSISYADIYGPSAAEEYQPKLVITYETGSAVHAAASSSHNLGVFGRGAMELQTGMLKVETEDLAWQGNRMPV